MLKVYSLIALILVFQLNGQVMPFLYTIESENSFYSIEITQCDSLSPVLFFDLCNDSFNTILVPSMFNYENNVMNFDRDIGMRLLSPNQSFYDTIYPHSLRRHKYHISDFSKAEVKYLNLKFYKDRYNLPIKLIWRIGDNAFSNVYHIKWVGLNKVQLIDTGKKPDFHIEGIIRRNVMLSYNHEKIKDTYSCKLYNDTDYDYFLIPELWSENNCPKIFDLETGEAFLWTDRLKQTEPVKLYKNKQNSLDFELDMQAVFDAYALDRTKEYGLIWQINNYYFTDMIKFSYKPKE